MSDVFIGYSSADAEIARLLARAFEARGLSVWWDRQIIPGKRWDAVIEKAIGEAHCVVVLWSAKSVKSDWVRAEASEGLERGVFVPVLIEDVKIPLPFKRVEAARLVGWDGNAEGQEFRQLMEAVRNHVLRRDEAKEGMPEPPLPPLAESAADSRLGTALPLAIRRGFLSGMLGGCLAGVIIAYGYTSYSADLQWKVEFWQFSSIIAYAAVFGAALGACTEATSVYFRRTATKQRKPWIADPMGGLLSGMLVGLILGPLGGGVFFLMGGPPPNPEYVYIVALFGLMVFIPFTVPLTRERRWQNWLLAVIISLMFLILVSLVVFLLIRGSGFTGETLLTTGLSGGIRIGLWSGLFLGALLGVTTGLARLAYRYLKVAN